MQRIRIDVRVTDEKILELIKSRATDGIARVTLSDIATVIGCAEKTAWTSTERLQDGGHLQKLGAQGRGGLVYRIVDADA